MLKRKFPFIAFSFLCRKKNQDNTGFLIISLAINNNKNYPQKNTRENLKYQSLKGTVTQLFPIVSNFNA